MAAIWMWVRSEQRRHRASLLVLAAVVALGVGPVLALAGGARRADSVYERFESRTGAANIAFGAAPEALGLDGTHGWTSLADSYRHLLVIDQVRAIDGVESAQVGSWAGVRPILNGEAAPASAGGLVEAFSVGYIDVDPTHPPFFVVAGTMPAPDDPQGVVMNEAAAAEAGLGIGSTVDFETADPSQLAEWAINTGRVAGFDGPRIHTEVRAIVRMPIDLVDPETPRILLMPGIRTAMGERFLNCACLVDVRVRAGQVDEVQARLEEIYRPFGLAVDATDSAGGATDAIGVEVTTLWIAALVASGAALIVLAQVTARSASSVITSNGARQALGMHRR